jgi:hypothetical protein
MSSQHNINDYIDILLALNFIPNTVPLFIFKRFSSSQRVFQNVPNSTTLYPITFAQNLNSQNPLQVVPREALLGF